MGGAGVCEVGGWQVVGCLDGLQEGHVAGGEFVGEGFGKHVAGGQAGECDAEDEMVAQEVVDEGVDVG